MHNSEEKAVCRGCGMVLTGKPYYMGGIAYHPKTGERCPSNYYGGFVCSYDCDRRSSLEQENSMPGHGRSQTLGCFSSASLKSNWNS